MSHKNPFPLLEKEAIYIHIYIGIPNVHTVTLPCYITAKIIYKHVLQVGTIEVSGSRVVDENRSEISIALQGCILKVVNACRRNNNIKCY